MTKQTIRNFVLAAAAAVVLSTGTAYAEQHRSRTVTINHDFLVDNTRMPAGDYRVYQDTMSEFASLVNTKTGQKVLFLRPRNIRTPGQVTVMFVPAENGVKIKVS